jgi:hypothetical protein
MAHLTLVLPFALPAPEFAPDLVRALQAPALATLLSKSASSRRVPLEGAARALPHELWIARALGLNHGAGGLVPGVAAAAMRGYGLDPGDGSWFVVNPAHIQISRSHLLMSDVRQLALREDEGRALFDGALPCFEEAGHELRYGAPDTWFMRADAWDEIRTSSPDAAVGMNLTDWMPSGPPARAFRKLQNEVQVSWYTHPVNAAREARGQPAVNSIWPWGEASSATEEASRLVANAGSRSLAPLAVASWEVPGWLAALGRQLPAPRAVLDHIDRATMLVCGNAAAPAIAADWHGWLEQMQRLEAELFAPVLDAVRGGRVRQLRLVLSHRDGHLETITTPMAQRKFWRRPTLEALT